MTAQTLLAVAVPLLLSLAAGTAASHLNVSTANGTVTGRAYATDGLPGWEFLGLPFAEAPVGTLRFARPQPRRTAWAGARMATKPGDRCPQIPFQSIDATVPPDQRPGYSEDCLFLNVWTPANASAAPRPVMVWIHGGGYTIGEGYPSYNARALAVLGDVVVVTVQYRLGPLGFLRLGDATPGNWGMWDQQLALRWVHENIAQFGGDPNTITAFGESAGASSVALHLLNLDSVRYFQRAILQSGSPTASWAVNPNATAVAAKHRQFAARVGCGGTDQARMLACMRAQNATALIQASATFMDTRGLIIMWLPVVDGQFLREAPSKTLAAKTMAKRNILMGANSDEGGMLVLSMMSSLAPLFNATPTSPAVSVPPLYSAIVNYMFRYTPYYPTQLSAEALAMIIVRTVSGRDLSNGLQNILLLNQALGDRHFVCPANEMADSYAAANNTVYFYEFARRTASSPYPAHIGATHAMEVEYVFAGFLVNAIAFNLTAGEQQLSRTMVADWAAFARTGRPASAGWKAYTTQKKEFYKLDTDPAPAPGEYAMRREACKFWTEMLPAVNSLALSAHRPTPKPPVCTCPTPKGCQPLNLAAKVLLGVLCAVVALNLIGGAVYLYRRSRGRNTTTVVM